MSNLNCSVALLKVPSPLFKKSKFLASFLNFDSLIFSAIVVTNKSICPSLFTSAVVAPAVIISFLTSPALSVTSEKVESPLFLYKTPDFFPPAKYKSSNPSSSKSKTATPPPKPPLSKIL